MDLIANFLILFLPQIFVFVCVCDSYTAVLPACAAAAPALPLPLHLGAFVSAPSRSLTLRRLNMYNAMQ